jgi:IS30 family transposase
MLNSDWFNKLQASGQHMAGTTHDYRVATGQAEMIRKRHNMAAPAEERKLAHEMREQGHSFAFIAEQLGRHPSSVRRWF